MKKILTALIALGFSISAQANSVMWAYGDFQPGPPGYALMPTSDPNWSSLIVFFEADGVTPFAAGGVLDQVGTTMFGNFANEATGFTPEATYTYQFQIFGPDDWVYDTGIKSFTMPGAASDFSLALSDKGTWTQIPEPATMALLGIGVVALGLRRRRK